MPRVTKYVVVKKITSKRCLSPMMNSKSGKNDDIHKSQLAHSSLHRKGKDPLRLPGQQRSDGCGSRSSHLRKRQLFPADKRSFVLCNIYAGMLRVGWMIWAG